MRIAYVTETYPPELNGVALTVERTVSYLRERGHVVDLIRPRQPGEPARNDRREWRTAGCRLPMYPDLRFGLARVSRLRERFETSACELVHIATPGPLAWAALAAAKALGIAVTTDFRTQFHTYSRYYRLGFLAPLVVGLLRRFHNLGDRTFVPTRAVRHELEQAGFHDLSVIGRGVDTARFSPAKRSAALRRAWGADDAAPVLLSLGRLAAEKNVELGLRAFEALRRVRPDARMVVVGDGPIRRRLEAAHPQARFVGALTGEALAEHCASADLFVFGSLSETFGNVTLEALASGLGVVAYDCAAAAEHIVDGTSGRLVRPGDEAAFVGAVVELGSRPERLASMRSAAVGAAQRARWSEVLGRFEAELASTLTAHEARNRQREAVA